MDKQIKKALKAKAHKLKPVVMIGAKGLTEQVLNEADIALDAHELIKIKVAGADKEEKVALAETLCRELDAEFIQKIGNIITIFREKKDD
jgi:RNA-binding protein